MTWASPIRSSTSGETAVGVERDGALSISRASRWANGRSRPAVASLETGGFASDDVSAGLGEHALQLLLVVAQGLLGLLDGDVAATDERLGVELADASASPR